MNLTVLKKSRRTPEVGDIFVLKPAGGKFFYYGRVISTDANPLGVGGAFLIYIYRCHAADKLPVPDLSSGQLLVPPMMTNKLPWSKGYFEFAESRPLTSADKLPRHVFRDTRGWFFDESGNRLSGPAGGEAVGQWGLHSFRTIDDEVSKALGIPASLDD